MIGPTVIAKNQDGRFLLEIEPGKGQIVSIEGKKVFIFPEVQEIDLKADGWGFISLYEAVYVTARALREKQRLETSTRFK